MNTNILEKTAKLTSNVSLDIEKAAMSVLFDIKDMVEITNKYEFQGELDFSSLCTIDSLLIGELGVRDRKRFKRLINKCLTPKSLRNYNQLLHFIAIHILKSSKRIRIVEPKHEVIQKLRKEWLELRDKAEEARLVYKGLKVNYYKNSLEIK